MTRPRLVEYVPIVAFAVLGLLVALRLKYEVTSPDAELPRWQGFPVWKTPGELWILQEIVHEVRPDVIVETGTYKGGTALFCASLLDMQGHGKVVSVDIKDWQPRPGHSRITYIVGSSTSPETLATVQDAIMPGEVVLVDLDSDHSREHVLAELRLYSPLVSAGSYVLVEDALRRARMLLPDYRAGPALAVDEFLSENHNFISDERWEERLGVSYATEYLRRMR